MAPPKVLSVEIKEADVRTSAIQIMHTMQKIRTEMFAHTPENEQLSLSERISPERKNEYLHLAYRLGSCIDGLKEGDFTEELRSITEALNSNPNLFSYDPLLESSNNFNQEFISSLNRALIFLTQDDFRGLIDKHHLLNGIKYLGSKDDSLENRLICYDTILPLSQQCSSNSTSTSEQKLEFEVHNYHGLLEKIAMIKISEEGEKNLVWELQNHHTQGRYFLRELKEKIITEGVDITKMPLETNLIKPKNVLILQNLLECSPYKKLSTIIFADKKRYVITLISNYISPESIGSIYSKLESGKSRKECLAEIVRQTKSLHTHFSAFYNEQKIDDLSCFGRNK